LRIVARYEAAKTTRWAITGMKRSSTSSGTTYVRPPRTAHARTARSSARDPRTDASERDRLQLSRRPDEPDDPVLDQLVDVDVPDRALQPSDLAVETTGP
jgi:hypothetical protein